MRAKLRWLLLTLFLAGCGYAALPGATHKKVTKADDLSHALTQKGRSIVSTRSLDDFPYDFHAWTVERGSVTLEIQFARFGGMGEDLPLGKSYACSVTGHDNISLYFSKPSGKWNSDVASFVSALDDRIN